MIIITRLELANRWSWRLEGLWEGVTILVVGGYVPNFHIQVVIDFCHVFHLVVDVDLLLCQGMLHGKCLYFHPIFEDLPIAIIDHNYHLQVGGKSADKGAVFTVSNGQLPGERG